VEEAKSIAPRDRVNRTSVLLLWDRPRSTRPGTTHASGNILSSCPAGVTDVRSSPKLT